MIPFGLLAEYSSILYHRSLSYLPEDGFLPADPDCHFGLIVSAIGTADLTSIERVESLVF